MGKVSVALQALPERFELQSQLGEGGMGIVYEARDHEAGANLAIKTLRKMAPEHLYWLKNEFRKLADVQHRNLVQLGELYCDANQCFFTMELVKGEDFRSHVRGREAVPREALGDDATSTMSQVSPDSYFTQAGSELDAAMVVVTTAAPAIPRFDEARLRATLRQLAEGIMALHARGLVHRDLKPSNVMVEQSGRVVLLDFGLADTLRRSDNDNGPGIYGTAAYMAPEQALSSGVAPASDWYAFGVMLFNALTGRLPFEGPAAHVLKAKRELEAPRASSLIQSCPEDLDELCAALLARDPEARPEGHEVLERLSSAGEGKTSSRRQRERVFVGREPELARLRQKLEAAAGGLSAVLLEGQPGVGKTELAEQFFASAALGERPLVVLRGRCYEQEFMPFKGIDALVDSLSRYLKSLPRADVRALLPPRFNLVAALFPVLYSVKAAAEILPPLEVNESKLEQRQEAIAQLGQLLANVGRSTRLIAFIDDLQWAGADSLALLHALCCQADAPAMMLLATCRTTDRWDGEERAGNAFSNLDGMSPVLLARFERLSVQALSSDDASMLMRHLCKASDDPRLSQLLDEAGGHPLFLQELARYADAAGELPTDLRLDHVLRERISRLDVEVRKLLEVVAIAGIPLQARVLARVAGLSRAESARAVRALRAEQLVRTDSGTESHTLEAYHDRVREAVLQGIRNATYVSALPMDLPSTHLELARQLLRARDEDALVVASTTVANHFNLGAPAIRAVDDHREAVARNLEAARQVKLASAYGVAAHYLAMARKHLVALPPSEQHAIERDIDLMDMEVAYLSNNAELGGQVFARLAQKSRTDLERARVFETRIMVETARNELAQAVATAREGLAQLGMQLPGKGSDFLLLRDMASFELRLRGRDPSALLTLPVSNDERVRAQMQILMAMTPAAFFSDPPLMSIAMVRMATLSLRGLTELSAYGFIGYALVLCAGFQQYRRGGAFSRLARTLNERFQNRALDAKIAHLHHFNCGTYVMDFADCKPGLREAQELGLKNGDLNFRTYGAVCTPMITLCAGQPLDLMKTECLAGVRVAEQEGNVDMAQQTQLRLRAIRCLEGENPSPTRMDAPESSEAEFMRAAEDAKLPTTNFTFGLMQAVLGVHFDDPALALKGAERAIAYQHAQFGLITQIDNTLYQTLAACTVAERTRDRSERRRMLSLANKNVRKLKKWADAHERNFSAHHHLASGELARVQGDLAKARVGLTRAISRGAEWGIHNIHGLAHERSAAWYAQQGRHGDRRAELERAVLAYRRWGAHACVERIEAQLRDLTVDPANLEAH